ncbi:MAG: dockerin type I domain-containing protein [Planctomycetota bacterium]
MSNAEKRSLLAQRVARHLAAVTVAAVTAGTASAAVQYTAVNLIVPNNIDGLYINVETLATGSAGSVVAGWDINPYSATSLTWFNATGTGMMRYPGATTGSAGNLAIGTIVGASGSYGSGAVVVGSAAGNWQLNALNRFGFRFIAADGQTHYGWGTFQIGASISGADRKITELAWETSPGVAISVGDTGGGGGPYDPCAPTNPSAFSGANNLFVNNTATTANLSCGTFYRANYYKFTAPATRNYDFSTCAAASGTRIAILDGCAAGSSVIACGASCGAGESLTLSATAGGVYYLVLGRATDADLASPSAVQVSPWYDPCDSTNPSASNGTNNLALNQTTAQNLTSSTCGFTIYKANYFKFVAPVSGSYTISTCASAADTRIAVTDSCDPLATPLGCNDNACGSSSSVTVDLIETLTYYIIVGGASPKGSLPSPIAVTVTPPPNPACSTAAAAVFGENAFANSGTVAQTVKSNLAGTTTATVSKSVWYSFTPATTGAYSISLCGATGDTMLAIGEVCPAVGTRFEAIAFNDDACLVAGSTTSNLASTIDATNGGATGAFAGFPLAQDLVAGVTYYILAGSYLSTAVLSGTLKIDGPPQGDPADLDGNGIVNAADLSILLAAWGPCSGCAADLNGSGSVDAADLATLLAAWG